MCGRYSVGQLSLPQLAERFQADPTAAGGHEPSWNVAPTSQVLAVTSDAARADGDAAERGEGHADGAGEAGGPGLAETPRRLRHLRWGLVPRWAKDLRVGNKMINLRADTVTTKPTFTRLLARHRCILPADGFYEWQDLGPDGTGRRQRKQPMYITTRDGTPLALAGLWTTWRDPDAADGEEDAGRVASCTIITTTPNQLMASVHTRMPVLLPVQAWDAWLDPDLDDVDVLGRLLVPAPDDLLTLWPVDQAVNTPRNNSPELTRPLEGHEPRTWP